MVIVECFDMDEYLIFFFFKQACFLIEIFRFFFYILLAENMESAEKRS